MDPETIKRFQALFQGNGQARGVLYKEPSRGAETYREAPNEDHFRDHLEGRLGLGIVPIREDSTCLWACIDVDAHDDDWYVEIDPIAQKINELGLPLIACQSRRKGAHVFLFLSEAQPAKKIKEVLQAWAKWLRSVLSVRSQAQNGKILGQATLEFFPKQEELSGSRLGNWLNLPYFDAIRTNRFAVNDNKILSLEEFLDLAESRRASGEQILGVKQGFQDAPPCVERLLKEGIHVGDRNNALFAVATYLRKTGNNDIDGFLQDINSNKDVMERPLTQKEVTNIAKSAHNDQYHYRCNESPLCGLCNKEVCKTRPFGIQDGKPTKMYDLVEFGELVKVLTDPPSWELTVNNALVRLSTMDLFDFKHVRRCILEYAGVIVPPMKSEDWAVFLRKKNEDRREVTAPEDATNGAMVWGALCDFTRRVEFTDEEGNPVLGKREDLLRGLPVVLQDSNGTYKTCFKGGDFISNLRRKRLDDFKAASLWAILRSYGCTHEKLRVGSVSMSIWIKPFQPWNVDLGKTEIREEF
jgi:hypothetical protein